MEQIAFRMRLNPGQTAEYKRRHDDIWPALVELLLEAGIRDYSIFHDEETNALFAVLRRVADHKMEQLPAYEIMQTWWRYMADIMATGLDGAPEVFALQPMFHMD